MEVSFAENIGSNYFLVEFPGRFRLPEGKSNIKHSPECARNGTVWNNLNKITLSIGPPIESTISRIGFNGTSTGTPYISGFLWHTMIVSYKCFLNSIHLTMVDECGLGMRISLHE